MYRSQEGLKMDAYFYIKYLTIGRQAHTTEHTLCIIKEISRKEGATVCRAILAHDYAKYIGV